VNSADLTPRRGFRFEHSRQLVMTRGVPCSQWPPETCTVTAVRNGAVYYRNTSGFLAKVAINVFPTVVGKILAD
jgi:hypothetical protein